MEKLTASTPIISAEFAAIDAEFEIIFDPRSRKPFGECVRQTEEPFFVWARWKAVWKLYREWPIVLSPEFVLPLAIIAGSPTGCPRISHRRRPQEFSHPEKMKTFIWISGNYEVTSNLISTTIRILYCSTQSE
jgi:hypothetical protein